MRFLPTRVARSLAALMVTTAVCGLLALGTPAARAQAPTPITSGSAVTYATGWNLVAFPGGTDLSQVTGPFYTWQPADTNYETIDPTQQATSSGFGYWAYFSSSTTLTLGAGSNDFYAVLAPAAQYIMIGNPSGTESAVVSGADAVDSYDPVAGYGTSPILNPGQGAWVISNSGGPITVTPTANATPPAPAGSQPPSARFYGSVTVNGSPASSGTTVTATSSSGASCGTTTVGAAPATGSNYALDLTGSDSGCTTSGATLSFSVAGSAATVSGQATVPDVSGAVQANLTVP